MTEMKDETMRKRHEDAWAMAGLAVAVIAALLFLIAAGHATK
jgi:hypothetical protein